MDLSPLFVLAIVAALAFVAGAGFSVGRRLGQSAERAAAGLEGSRVAAERARFEAISQRVPVLERELTGKRWLVGDRVTLADIALFAYTHVADEAGYRLADYPAISAWIASFKALPWYAPITTA